ncbi:MAG: FecR domain-containing protein [Steroidobacteraceae bacterium]
MASESETLATESAIWLARLERGLQSGEGAQLREWLLRPGHRTAIVEHAKLWHGPDIIAVLAELVPVGFGLATPPKGRRIRSGALIFGLGLAIFMVWPAFMIQRAVERSRTAQYGPGRDALWGETRYTTKPAETRAVTLVDGSKITLNGHTQVRLVFAAGSRFATVDYGEAIFQVSNESQRDFEINAAGRLFRAPPSLFDVRVINPKVVELLVLDGGVRVKGLPWHWPDTPAEARIFDPSIFIDTTVGPLQAALLEQDALSRYPVTAANAQARLRWRPEDVFFITP